MTKYFMMLLVALATISCSKKVDVSGNFVGASPLERVEFIEASGVATLPLINMGVDPKGNFSGTFEAPKDGMYIMSFAGKQAMIYLKGGQDINISGQAVNFPEKFTISGKAKKNNDFLKKATELIQSYAAKINIGELVNKDEPAFLKEVEKIQSDLEKNIDKAAESTSPDSDVVQWKKDELIASVLGLMNQYEISRPIASKDPNFKVSKKFTELEKKLNSNETRLLRSQPIYRNYLIGKLSKDFQKYAETHNKSGDELSSVLFAQFLDTKKDLAQLAKDYLLAYVLSNGDINPSMTTEDAAKISKLVDEKIKDSEIKKDLKQIQFVISGPKVGDAFPAAKLIMQDGNDFKVPTGKPTLVMFYASWNPYIADSTIPVLKEVVKFYQTKLDFVAVNLDDTKEQFIKTSNAMMKGINGTNVYGENGMNSAIAKDLGIYGFKLPSFVVLDKDGKFASHFFYDLGDEKLIQTLDKVTGLKAPESAPEATLQNDLLVPNIEQEPASTK